MSEQKTCPHCGTITVIYHPTNLAGGCNPIPVWSYMPMTTNAAANPIPVTDANGFPLQPNANVNGANVVTTIKF